MHDFTHIALDDTATGMTLAVAVTDAKGAILLPGATVLTDAMRTSLQRRGIERVCIVNERPTAAALAAQREQIQARLAVLFRHCAPEHATALLRQSILNYRLGDMR